jgi:hypothetical protein
MKKVFLFLFITTSFVFSQITITKVDTVSFARDSNATAYAAGDIVRYYPSAAGGYLFSFPVTSNAGEICEVAMFADTANATNATFTVMFFSDTVGLKASGGYLLPIDNAAFQTQYYLSKYYIGQTQLALAMYGTTGGGATTAGDINTILDMHYFTSPSRIFFVVLTDAAYTPKSGGLFRVHIKTEQKL